MFIEMMFNEVNLGGEFEGLLRVFLFNLSNLLSFVNYIGY